MIQINEQTGRKRTVLVDVEGDAAKKGKGEARRGKTAVSAILGILNPHRKSSIFFRHEDRF